MERILAAFGVVGWVELFAAFVVAIGCAGELWLLINKLTLQIEPLGKSAGRFWRALAWMDSKVRPFLVRLKVKGRKLPEAREQLLERLFVILVAFGVAVEFLALPVSMHEVATLNEEAKQAGKDAGQANLQVVVLSNETVRLSANLEDAKSKNIELAKQVFGLATQTELISTNIAQVRDMVNSPEITAKLNETKLSLTEANKTLADVKEVLTSSNLDALSNLKPKSLKERIIDCVNSIDARIIPRLASSSTSIPASGEAEHETFFELRKLAAEPGAWQYLQINDNPHGSA
ncbi:MAG TPA: hypothetical protein VFC17_08820, partial [Candidatus Limnocylindrales bacterium]|nr:hypothetical protein [Candidatus Limnocylindrales bacterium]